MVLFDRRSLQEFKQKVEALEAENHTLEARQEGLKELLYTASTTVSSLNDALREERCVGFLHPFGAA